MCENSNTREGDSRNFVQIVNNGQAFLSGSNFSWPEKHYSRDFSIFRVFTQPRSPASYRAFASHFRYAANRVGSST
jgi:hypothetical protein